MSWNCVVKKRAISRLSEYFCLNLAEIVRANLTDSGFKFERINLRKNLKQSKFGAKFAALKLLYKVANLSENFKKWLKIDLVSATTANLTFVRLKLASKS